MTAVRAGAGVVLLLITAVPVLAQSNVGGGVKIGVNVATISGSVVTRICGATAPPGAKCRDDRVSKAVRSGMSFGGFLAIAIGDTLFFEPELVYSREGVNLSLDGTEFASTIRIDVIQLPFLFRYAKRGDGKIRPYVVAGPAIGIVIKAKEEDPIRGSVVDFEDDLRSTDLRLIFGGGVDISPFLVEARYSAAMTTLNEDEPHNINKSRVFAIHFGVRF
jgi:hypothetical protein